MYRVHCASASVYRFVSLFLFQCHAELCVLDEQGISLRLVECQPTYFMSLKPEISKANKNDGHVTVHVMVM